MQQTFYFVNPSISADEEYLWFYCAHPPALYRTLGVVGLNPDRPFIRHFPAAQFVKETPLVTPEGVYYNCADRVYLQRLEGEPELVMRLDRKWVNNRPVHWLAVHLTRSADGRQLLLDGHIGAHWFIAVGDLATGEITILKEFGRQMNHAQFHPTDPTLFLLSEDWWFDKISGKWFAFDHRSWLMTTTMDRFEPLRPKDWFGHGSSACHEWWSKDGLVCWVDYERGAFEVDPNSGEARHVWPTPLCHAHCDSTRRFWCADESPYKWKEKPCEVKFFDRDTGRTVPIVTAMQAPIYERGDYHLDPHPQFSPRDSWICYTTMVRDRVDVALSPVHLLKD